MFIGGVMLRQSRCFAGRRALEPWRRVETPRNVSLAVAAKGSRVSRGQAALLSALSPPVSVEKAT
jgi:hypothetical protein